MKNDYVIIQKMIEIHLSLGPAEHWHNDGRIQSVFSRMLRGILCAHVWIDMTPGRPNRI